jgi:uncharacterized Zn finger protein
MKTKRQSRFDLRALRDLAGERSFARGTDYHRNGQVQLIAIEAQRILAQVAGTDDYRTELRGRGKTIDGNCSCPAFEDRGFCKHMVAAALAANAAGSDAEAEGAGVLARIKDHLKTRGVDALVGMIMDLAERDPALFRKLDVAATAVHADDKTLEARLRWAIDGATRTRGFVDYREAAGWAAGVEEALDTVAVLAQDHRAGLALRLVVQAMARIERAIESIDDSDGHCGALLERARDIHLAACRAAKPDPVGLARDLFARETDGAFDAFHAAAPLYADVLGERGLAEYRRLAAEAWSRVPARTGHRSGENDTSIDRLHLLPILDFFAEREGDVQARIDLRARDLSSQWSYLQLAEFCQQQGRDEEALRHAEEGLWVFEDGRGDERLVFFAVDLLSKTGRKRDAEAHLWRTWEKAPSLELYKRLRKLGGKASGERAVERLEVRLLEDKRTRWNFSADLLIRILTLEKQFDAAWAAVRQHGAAMGEKDTLARASEATHPREALETYAGRIEELANAGGNPAYAMAAELVEHIAKFRSAAEHAAYLDDLKQRHGRKRNFMKLLK